MSLAKRWLGGAIGLAVLLAVSGASAQTGSDKPPDTVAGGDALKGNPVPKGLVAPGNGGVAGTGLGGKKDTAIGGASGTGNSVTGPAGSGIDGGKPPKMPSSP